MRLSKLQPVARDFNMSVKRLNDKNCVEASYLLIDFPLRLYVNERIWLNYG